MFGELFQADQNTTHPDEAAVAFRETWQNPQTPNRGHSRGETVDPSRRPISVHLPSSFTIPDEPPCSLSLGFVRAWRRLVSPGPRIGYLYRRPCLHWRQILLRPELHAAEKTDPPRAVDEYGWVTQGQRRRGADEEETGSWKVDRPLSPWVAESEFS